MAIFEYGPKCHLLKPTIYFLLFGLLFSTLNAQEQDPYEAQALTAVDPLDRLEALDTLIYRNRRADIDAFIHYSQLYIKTAKEIDSFEWAAKKMINLSYSLTSRKNDPNRTLEMIDSLLMHKAYINDGFVAFA